MRKGLTLIELIFTTLLMGIVLLGVYIFIIQAHDVNNKTVRQVSSHSVLNFIQNAIETDIKNGTGLSVSNDGKTLNITTSTGGNTTYSFIDNSLKKNGRDLVKFQYKAEVASNFTFSDRSYLILIIHLQNLILKHL